MFIVRVRDKLFVVYGILEFFVVVKLRRRLEKSCWRSRVTEGRLGYVEREN